MNNDRFAGMHGVRGKGRGREGRERVKGEERRKRGEGRVEGRGGKG